MSVDIRDLVVDRGHREVLHGISAHLPAGEITGILGPSGSGKTTLLRAVVGVQLVRSGSVMVLGVPAGAPELRHRVGYVAQSPSVYPDLTVTENVRFFAALQGHGPEAADRAMAAAGLDGVRRQLTADLSGGQLSRTSLACAMVGDPQVLVLDEPTVGQDPVLREELWSWFRSLAEQGRTLLVSSHVMDEANRCDRLLLVRDGSVLAHDTPSAVKASAGTEDLDEAFLRLIRRTSGEVA
ncbi:MAG: multidrug ABC transporter ATP-binding protein [Acidobacteria bacterium]|nr:MAG: multidrug ABC transporter ATP-binding protein [Acidobacteriota bacterium]